MVGCVQARLTERGGTINGGASQSGLRALVEEKSALLAAAEERLARLEALHSIAQVSLPHIHQAVRLKLIFYQRPATRSTARAHTLVTSADACGRVQLVGSRLKHLGLHSNIQETALRAEEQLEEMHSALSGLGDTAKIGRSDASNARQAYSPLLHNQSIQSTCTSYHITLSSGRLRALIACTMNALQRIS